MKKINVQSRLISSELSKRDLLCIGTVLIGLFLMHFTPILTSLGTPIALVVSFISVFNPYSAVLFVAGSQIAPDPKDIHLTLAQMFVFFWLITLPWNGCVRYFGAINRCLRYLLPFMLWWFLAVLVNGTLQTSWVYAYITGLIICTYVPRVHNLHLLLWMLVLGTGLGVIGYWGHTFHLPIVGKNYEHLWRGGFRPGSGRGDVNTTAQNLGFCLYVALALILARVKRTSSQRAFSNTQKILFVGVLTIPPLLATGSRGGIGYFVLGGIALIVCLGLAQRLKLDLFPKVMLAMVVVVLLLSICWVPFMNSSIGKMVTATLAFNQSQAEKSHSSALVAGRSAIWSKYIDIVIEHPILGFYKGAYVDLGEYGAGIVGKNSLTGGTGHNVFLDVASTTGIPGLLMFMVVFFMPIIHMTQRGNFLYTMPFIIAHVMVFLVFSNLSVGNWKTYWALFVITVIANSRIQKGSSADGAKQSRLV